MAARYLLDTNICIYIAKHNPPAVRERFARHSASELAMSVITLGELRFGAEKSQARERALATIQQLQTLIEVCPVPQHAGEHYGQIRASLQQAGLPIGNNDLRDMHSYVAAIPNADVLVGEKLFVNLALQARLDKRYGCALYSKMSQLESFL